MRNIVLLVLWACTMLFVSGTALAQAAQAAAPVVATKAVKLEGQLFQSRVDVAGISLPLNGTGVRSVAWFKSFVAGLYLMQPANAPEQAANMAGPKRLQIRMLQTVPAGECVKALNKGVARNVTPEQLAALQVPLAQFAQLVGELRELSKGDVVDLDHEPGRGLVMQVNGTLRANAVFSDDLFAAVLASFVGKRPFDERLKAGLLGRKG